MEITSDIALRGAAWEQAIDAFAPLFKPRSQYSIYMLSLAIGIMYDRRITSDEEHRHSVPRNVIQNNDNGKLDFMFQTAILSTTTENFSEDQRLELAFGENVERKDFKKIDFLTQFANFGVTKLVEYVGSSSIESMENIKNFLASIVEGNNFDIDVLPDELLTEDV